MMFVQVPDLYTTAVSVAPVSSNRLGKPVTSSALLNVTRIKISVGPEEYIPLDGADVTLTTRKQASGGLDKFWGLLDDEFNTKSAALLSVSLQLTELVAVLRS